MKIKLTLEEKLKLLTGKNLWEIDDLGGKLPTFFMSDGPHGLRKMRFNGNYWEDIPSNAYVNNVNLANTWNKDLARLQGNLIAEDCIDNNVDLLLAPGVNIKRTPLCGRNFEYFSEDPFFAGQMAKAYIEGVQEKGVGSCLKHFAANNREVRRSNQSSEVDERTLHEIYLEAFRIALEAKPFAVMCSYNPVNGIYASENKHLLKDILRDEFHYQGLIVSDWCAVHNGAKAVKAGLNLRMPFDKDAYDQLLEGYKKGLISDKDIDESVEYIIKATEKAQENKKAQKVQLNKQERLDKALEIAEESIVLLKNNGVLPLNSKEKALIVGELDAHPYLGGGGSAYVRSEIQQKPLSAILNEKGFDSIATKHCFLDTCNPFNSDREAVRLAEKVDVSIILVGDNKMTEGEGYDRASIKLNEREETLIRTVAENSLKSIVVIEAGSAIDMSGWIDYVDAVIFAGYLGDVANQAIANILTGEVCPSAKLSETFLESIEDHPLGTYAGEGSYETYDEKLYVGYRGCDEYGIVPMFPFGFGLSYAEFEYSNLKIKKLKEDEFEVSFDIKNVSDIDAKEISQVYVRDVTAMVDREYKSLKGFSKDLIKAQETKRVSIVLDRHAFAFYDVNNKEYYVENGRFEIMVGSSSEEIWLNDFIDIELDEDKQHSIY